MFRCARYLQEEEGRRQCSALHQRKSSWVTHCLTPSRSLTGCSPPVIHKVEISVIKSSIEGAPLPSVAPLQYCCFTLHTVPRSSGRNPGQPSAVEEKAVVAAIRRPVQDEQRRATVALETFLLKVDSRKGAWLGLVATPKCRPTEN